MPAGAGGHAGSLRGGKAGRPRNAENVPCGTAAYTRLQTVTAE